MASLPLSVNLSRLIVLGYAFNVLHESIVIAAALSLKSIFKLDINRRMEIYSKKMDWARSSGSDCLAIYNVFQDWNVQYEDGTFDDPEKEIKWCRENFIERKIINDVRELVKEIIDRLDMLDIECLGLDEPWKPAQRDLVVKSCLAGAFYPNFYQRRKIDEEEICRRANGENPFKSVWLINNVEKVKQIDHDSIYLRLYEDQIKEQFVKHGICGNKNRIRFDFFDGFFLATSREFLATF
jgi:ATP-dependent RNA helicase TDRD9